MVEFRSLRPDQWPDLRKVRLRALLDSPENFLATSEAENQFTKADWLTQFARGTWTVGTSDKVEISLVGITHDNGDSGHDRTKHFVEFMWVAPEHRKLGIAREMLDYAIDAHFRSYETTEECHAATDLHLWVLDGNWPAYWLYKRIGFAPDNVVNELEMKPGRKEELMTLNLNEHYAVIQQQPSLLDLRR